MKVYCKKAIDFLKVGNYCESEITGASNNCVKGLTYKYRVSGDVFTVTGMVMTYGIPLTELQFNEHFCGEREYRKLKLEKINGK